MAVRIDGKAVAAKVRGEIAEEVAALKKQGVQTGMAVVLVGEDPASKIYVRNKGKACAETGIYSEEHVLPENTTQEELLALIEKLNADPKINGILVQSPLPKHLNEALIVEHIDPKKDVDAFHAENVGRIMIGDFAFLPCTPAGIIELIRSTGVTIDGKNCVVIGRSNIVGKPMAMLLLHENGTVAKNGVSRMRSRSLLWAIGFERFNQRLQKRNVFLIRCSQNCLRNRSCSSMPLRGLLL